MSAIDYTSIACEYCGARKGQGCTTSPGGHATRPHDARTRPLRDAWLAGYNNGQEDLLRSPGWYERERRRWLAKGAQL